MWKLAAELVTKHCFGDGPIKFDPSAIPVCSPLDGFAAALEKGNSNSAAAQITRLHTSFSSFFGRLRGTNNILDRALKMRDRDSDGSINSWTWDYKGNWAITLGVGTIRTA